LLASLWLSAVAYLRHTGLEPVSNQSKSLCRKHSFRSADRVNWMPDQVRHDESL